MNTIKKYRNIILRIIDIIIIAVAYYIAEVLINSSFTITNKLNHTIVNSIVIAVIVYSSLLHIFKTYENITRYENGNDYLVYVIACFVSFVSVIAIKLVTNIQMVKIRTNMIAALIIVTSVISYRVILRFILTEGYRNKGKIQNNLGYKNVLIVGAGDATRIVLRTLKTNMKGLYNIVGLIDDNTNKVNYAISGNKILGTRYDIPRICKENNVEAILFTISNISSQARRDILNICQETGCKLNKK